MRLVAKIVFASVLATLMSSAEMKASAENASNALTDSEKTTGWKLLFDGKTTDGWRTYKRNDVAPGWKVVDGTLACVDPKTAGDLVTTEKFDWFELALEYNISAGAIVVSSFIRSTDRRRLGNPVPRFSCWITTRKADKNRSWLAGCINSISQKTIPRQESRSMQPSRPASGTSCGFWLRLKSAKRT